jgi:SAM-dependent methyltransferase
MSYVLNVLRYGPGLRGKARKLAAKARRRAGKFSDQSAWQQDEGFARRSYPSYQAYADHQRAKLVHILDRLNETLEEDFAEFQRRFRDCGPLREARSVLCLGARLGTEVRALRDLGLFAVGIDLNPGADNPYVLSGDFHALQFADRSVDAVYTNALDHAFDLEGIVGEVARVLRPGGLFVVDMPLGFEQGYIPGDYEALIWRDPETLVQRLCRGDRFAVVESRDLGRVRRDACHQVVLRQTSASRIVPARRVDDPRRERVLVGAGAA